MYHIVCSLNEKIDELTFSNKDVIFLSWDRRTWFHLTNNPCLVNDIAAYYYNALVIIAKNMYSSFFMYTRDRCMVT